MSIFDGKRIPDHVFRIDVDRIIDGYYSAQYFQNLKRTLRQLSEEGYLFEGASPQVEALGLDPSSVAVGDIEGEVQIFARRRPGFIVGGVDEALAILRACTGYVHAGRFVNTFDQLQVWAVHDGTYVAYSGDPRQVRPVMKIRGRIRDFCHLESVLLGVMAEPSRVATNVFEVLKAARGKAVLNFCDRFMHYKSQPWIGYGYKLGVEAYNHMEGGKADVFVSTDASADFWHGQGGGTMAHINIGCFLGDTAEATVQMGRTLDARTPRIALVDFHNNTPADSLKVMRRMFFIWLEHTQAGRHTEAARYKLNGVRLDNSLVDESLTVIGDPKLDKGVVPRLVFKVRETLDNAWREWGLADEWVEVAQRWCKEVQIVVSGGFDPEKIAWFESLGTPVDVYGVGSSLISNTSANNTDFTMDLVRVKVGDQWIPMAKKGRTAADNPELERVQ